MVNSDTHIRFRYSGLVVLWLIFNINLYAQEKPRLEANDFFSKDAPSKVALALSPDGKYLAKNFSLTGILNLGKGKTYSTQIFNATTLQPYRQFKNAEVIDQLIFTPDSKFLVGKYGEAAWRSYVCVWNMETGEMKESPLEYFPISIDISPDGKSLLVGGRYTCIYDFTTMQVIRKFKSFNYSWAKFLDGGKYIVTSSGGKMQLWDTSSGVQLDEKSLSSSFTWRETFIQVNQDRKLFALPFSTKNEIYKVVNEKFQWCVTLDAYARACVFDESRKSVFLINNSSVIRYNTGDGVRTGMLGILPSRGGNEDHWKSSQNGCLVNLTSINQGNHLLITDYQGVSNIYSVKKNTIEAIIYTKGDQDYAFVTPDGRMEGTSGAIENLHWVIGKHNVPLVNTYDQMYTPHLLSQIFADELKGNEVTLDALIKMTPEIRITSPETNLSTSSLNLAITCEFKENGDEIKLVRIYVNDKLVSDETRGMKSLGNAATYNVTLLPGVNSVKAVAITKNGYQSKAASVSVTCSGTIAESRLFVMVVGIDKYKNPAYNLNYAVADASSVLDRIRNSASGIFRSIYVYNYQNESAKRDSILGGFDRVALQARPQDAFILFYAGHGVMSEGTPEVPKDFYLVLHGVTQLYGKDEILRDQGISAVELRELSRKITAQKQVVFLDACQSGAAVETFAMRGAAEEKAILQLARSTGSYLIASTGSEQYATEFKELGHGVFTYALLQGLNCNSEGAGKGKKVTIKELEAYLNDNIPILTEKYHGTVQYPKSWSKGMDFPIVICE
ncbi:MAG: caspase family protein [Bacteroidota bacterium]